MNPRNDQNQPQDYQPKTLFSEPTSPSIAQPDVYGQVPSNLNSPYGGQPVVPATPNPAFAPQPPGKAKKGLIIVTIIGVLLIVILAGVVLATNSSKKSSKTQNGKTDTQAGQAQILQPAQAIELEQTNNSINQDLSGLDDEKDFPATSLDDKNLGL